MWIDTPGVDNSPAFDHKTRFGLRIIRSITDDGADMTRSRGKRGQRHNRLQGGAMSTEHQPAATPCTAPPSATAQPAGRSPAPAAQQCRNTRYRAPMDFREIMRTVSDVLMIAGATMALATFVLMQYLSRGVYNPLDAIVLILMSLAMLACPALLAAGAVIRIIMLVSGRKRPGTSQPRNGPITAPPGNAAYGADPLTGRPLRPQAPPPAARAHPPNPPHRSCRPRPASPTPPARDAPACGPGRGTDQRGTAT